MELNDLIDSFGIEAQMVICRIYKICQRENIRSRISLNVIDLAITKVLYETSSPRELNSNRLDLTERCNQSD